MSKPGRDNQRKKQLNVVYFIDSSRTRSFRMSMPRLNLFLTAFALMLVWSIASVFLIIWMGEDRRQVGERIRSAMATIFDYETRYDGAYEVAYPLDAKGRPSIAATGGKTPGRPNIKAASPMSAPIGAEATVPPPAVAGQTAPVPAPAPVAPVAVAPTAPAVKVDVAQPAADTSTTENKVNVTIENPVLEPKGNSLELHFDIKSKGSARAEGYVWAVAEFKADSGNTLYLGAPPSIEVQPDGEPGFPRKANKFAVRYYKRKTFNFQITKDAIGSFTEIRIGVMGNNTGKSGDRMIYKVPVDIRVGGPGTKPGGPQKP